MPSSCTCTARLCQRTASWFHLQHLQMHRAKMQWLFCFARASVTRSWSARPWFGPVIPGTGSFSADRAFVLNTFDASALQLVTELHDHDLGTKVQDHDVASSSMFTDQSARTLCSAFVVESLCPNCRTRACQLKTLVSTVCCAVFKQRFGPGHDLREPRRGDRLCHPMFQVVHGSGVLQGLTWRVVASTCMPCWQPVLCLRLEPSGRFLHHERLHYYRQALTGIFPGERHQVKQTQLVSFLIRELSRLPHLLCFLLSR